VHPRSVCKGLDEPLPIPHAEPDLTEVVGGKVGLTQLVDAFKSVCRQIAREIVSETCVAQPFQQLWT
jgi:hypothetical protein